MSTCVSLGGSQTNLELNWRYNSPVADTLTVGELNEHAGVDQETETISKMYYSEQHSSEDIAGVSEQYVNGGTQGVNINLNVRASGSQQQHFSDTLTVGELNEHAGVDQETETIPKMYYSEQHSSEDIADESKQYVNGGTQGVNINLNARASGSQQQHFSDEEHILELKEFPLEQQEDNSISVEALQKRVCLVKLYAWVKQEMPKSAAKSIASHLYQSEHKLLSRSDHESILHCSWRRDAVEQLLKKVLMGPCDIYEIFIRALKEHEEKHIAEKLERVTASESEIQVFTMLEQSSLGQRQRPDIHEQRLGFTKSDIQTLLYYLNNNNTIDSLNDHLLSRFIFSIREHTNVVHCSLDDEKRVKQLIDTMKVCAEKIFKDFCEILNSIKMSHVIGKLEKRSQGDDTVRQRQKRKSASAQGTESETSASTSSSAKRQCLNSSVECRLVTSMQRSSSTLKQQARDQLGFDVENVNKGSIVIQLCPKELDSWHRLEENCQSGKIKDFIPVVYNNEVVHDLLEEGEYRLKFTIYTLPTQTDKQEEKKVMFHLETEEKLPKEKPESDNVSTSHHENLLEECSDLLCEELEINKDLLSLLKKKTLVEDGIKDEIDKQGSRVKKIKYLLKKIGMHGQKGYEVLKEYIKEDNEDLYKALVTREEVKAIDSKMDTAAKVTKNRPSNGGHRGFYKKEVFFTGIVVLVVKKNVGKKKGAQSITELEITCPEILDPVCHFAEKGKENQSTSGGVTMVLEEAWSLVGGKQPPKRASNSKRAHSVIEEEDSEIDDAVVSEEVETPDTDLKANTSGKEESLKEKQKSKTQKEQNEDSCEKEGNKKEERKTCVIPEMIYTRT